MTVVAADETLSSGVHEGSTGLPEPAERLVAAARRVLARDGFGALTVEAVAAESGEYRDAIRYYFGGKSGLVAAVVDSLAHDQSLEAMHKAKTPTSGGTRIGTLVDGDRRMAQDTGEFRDFFELLPHVLKDEDLRRRVAGLYDWYRTVYLEGLSVASSGRRLRSYASLMAAMTDGLALQKALDPEGVDLEALFSLWIELLEATLGRELEDPP